MTYREKIKVHFSLLNMLQNINNFIKKLKLGKFFPGNICEINNSIIL